MGIIQRNSLTQGILQSYRYKPCKSRSAKENMDLWGVLRNCDCMLLWIEVTTKVTREVILKGVSFKVWEQNLGPPLILIIS